ncbi:hypothetical protein GGTG_12621 [Gaeumannomyces tritici R3-111a-1]|uniref:Aminoglycoside phosphotransferase domain-containing protein n=1 Tax=Gaeumannomyces tritici (strain R3-111a-1) TaxID=644352 RepID=J3PGJ3_GAET3|nr:hypothetical protein GGTG_12621 [Gaeumannomyces tritici R3-111a-1]EJT69738.1 hypothetical protein GGTG_12621 [Gaeumannomyces tritici R3-111a-1]
MYTPPTIPYYAPESDLPAPLPTWEEIYAQTQTTYIKRLPCGQQWELMYRPGEWVDSVKSTFIQVGEHYTVSISRVPIADERDYWDRELIPRPYQQDIFTGAENMMFLRQMMGSKVRIPKVYAMYKHTIEFEQETCRLNIVVREFIPGKPAKDFFTRAAAFKAILFDGPSANQLKRDKALIGQRVFLGQLAAAEGRSQMRELEARLADANAATERREQEWARRRQLYKELTEPQLTAFGSLDVAEVATWDAWPPCIKTYTRGGVVCPILTIDDLIECWAVWSADPVVRERNKQQLREKLKGESMAFIHPAGVESYGLLAGEGEILSQDGSVVTVNFCDLAWGPASFSDVFSDAEQVARTARVMRDARAALGANPDIKPNFDHRLYKNVNWSRVLTFPALRAKKTSKKP